METTHWLWPSGGGQPVSDSFSFISVHMTHHPYLFVFVKFHSTIQPTELSEWQTMIIIEVMTPRKSGREMKVEYLPMQSDVICSALMDKKKQKEVEKACVLLWTGSG